MIGLITEALQAGFAAFERDDMVGYAHHTGKAGGIAAATGVYGIKALSLCDDISDAYEIGDADFMVAILDEATERPDNPSIGAATGAEKSISWPEYGAALHQAVEADAAGDKMRYALMTGFVSGLMFNDPGPNYPDRGTILDSITVAYENGSAELLHWAQARIAAGNRLSEPLFFVKVGAEDAERQRVADASDRYYEERMRMMRWVQNFGLRNARAEDEKVAVPGSMAINHSLRRQALRGSDPDRTTTREPGDAESYIKRGGAKKGRGDYEGAIADYDRAIAFAPDNADAYYLRGDAKRVMGDYDGAIADCDRAIALDPDNSGGCNIRGMSKWEQGDSEGAIADFDRAIELDPAHAAAYYIRGMIKEETGDHEGAIPDFDRAIELGHDSDDVYNYRACAKSHMGNYEGAIADLDRSIELDPDAVWTYRYRGYAKMNLEWYEGAIADFDRVLELDPNDEYAREHRDIARSHTED